MPGVSSKLTKPVEKKIKDFARPRGIGGNDEYATTTNMSRIKTSKADLNIELNRLNDALKAKWPAHATIMLIKQTGRGYTLCASGHGHSSQFPGSAPIAPMKTREMHIYLMGLTAGVHAAS